MSTLRTAERLRAPEFSTLQSESAPEMVKMAATIIACLTAKFEPARFRDRYGDALRALVAAKSEDKLPPAQPTEAQSAAIDLMSALKESVAAAGKPETSQRKQAAQPDRRQGHVLWPIKGGERQPAAHCSKHSVAIEREQWAQRHACYPRRLNVRV